MDHFNLTINGKIEKIPVYYGGADLKPLSDSELFVLRYYAEQILKMDFKPLSIEENNIILGREHSFYHNSVNEGVGPSNDYLALEQIILFLRVPLKERKLIAHKYKEEMIMTPYKENRGEIANE